MKYVIVEKSCLELPIIFPDVIEHGMFQNVISAGFCKIGIGNNRLTVSCWGKSSSLGVKSRAGDSQILEKEINRDFYD